MPVTVCTGWSPRGWLEYGKTFKRTFREFWPESVEGEAYVEELAAGTVRGDTSFVERSLWDCSGMSEFLQRHEHEPVANGREFRVGHNWKHGDLAKGYSFRYDAVKFSRQCFIPETAAARLPDGDILVWLDGDVVTHSPVPSGFIEGLVGDSDGVYLGRGRKHSEIGFWAMRLGGHTRAMLGALASWYRTSSVFELKEWHSAFVWDHTRRAAEANGARFADLTPNGHDHVWHQSPLAAYTDHLKGGRKALGRSPERVR
jgi:hypothetical protein